MTPELFRKYPAIADFASASLKNSPRKSTPQVSSTTRPRVFIGAARTILEEFGGEIPRDIDKLLTVPGCARKTANVVLGTGFGIASGVVVEPMSHASAHGST